MNDATRRRYLAGIGTAVAAGLAGCNGLLGSDDDESPAQQVEVPALTRLRGSGSLVEGRPQPAGPSITELPDLSGELSLYLGGGEGGIYREFVDILERAYPEFTVLPTRNTSSTLAQTIVDEVESGASRADVFWSIDASSLAYVTQEDANEPLPDTVTGSVPDSFIGPDGSWVGVAGRARAVPYNTNELSESDIPNAVAEFPETPALQGTMGWAPTYGAFKSFITAMRLRRGEDAARQWLVDMREAGTERYGNEYVVSQQVADGALAAGFANHYYALRVKNQRPDAPIDLAFTEGDAGALVDVAGATRIQGTDNADLADLFIRHLLTAEAQEFFATRSFAYPMIDGVEPVGDLPPISELNPPEIDLSKLSDIAATLELMEEAGVSG
ncbi:iron ABC transporter substrate-binding protein [Halobacteriales archaeon SW_8_65_20]|nr:MAG: iron ABC transporter substrate-binding protein [Halobacteriales archaeon QH_7_65_31]PSQ52597.1 MAG: iron ABC transporter substrate-binding protein [Halobacteriales archaeon SW_8_65_20]